MKKLNYITIASVALIFSNISTAWYLSRSEKSNQTKDLMVVKSGDKRFSLMKSKNSIMVDCEFPGGLLRIGNLDADGKKLNAVAELKHGDYIYVCDENCDGFPEFGIRRDSSKRVRFKFKETDF